VYCAKLLNFLPQIDAAIATMPEHLC
jgi:hypothetical protein